MKRLLFATLLVSLSLQFGCTRTRESTTEAAREPERMSNSDLEKKIKTHLDSDPQLRAANLSVDANADRNWATLSGTVQTESIRAKALNMAKMAQPGLKIDDKIEVRPREMTRSEYTPELAREEVERAKAHRETVGGTLDDAWIHSKIVAQLIVDKDTPERKINIDVDHSVVTLRGTVNTMEQKQEAERIARQTDGVKRVNNLLKVAKT